MKTLSCIVRLALCLVVIAGCGERQQQDATGSADNRADSPARPAEEDGESSASLLPQSQEQIVDSPTVDSVATEKDKSRHSNPDADPQQTSQKGRSNRKVEQPNSAKKDVPPVMSSSSKEISVPELMLAPRVEQGTWSLALRFRLKHHKKGEVKVAFSPAGDQFASIGSNRVVKAWDAVTGQERKSIQLAKESVLTVSMLQYLPDGKLLAVGDFKQFQLINTNDWAVEHQFKVPLGSEEISRDGKLLAIRADYDSEGPGKFESIRFFELPSGKERKKLDLRPWKMRPVSVLDPRTVIVQRKDHSLAVYDSETAREGQTFDGPQNRITDVVLSPSGKLLAAFGYGFKIWVWNWATGEAVQSIQIVCSDLEFVDDETLLVDEYLVDIRSGVRLDELPQNKQHSFAVSPTKRWIVSGGFLNGEVIVTDLFRSREQRVFTTGDSSVWAIAWSPNGKLLATSGTDKLIRLWDTETGKVVGSLGDGILKSVQSRLVFSPNGETLISLGGHHEFGYRWNLKLEAPTHSILNYGEDLHVGRRDVAFLPDGRILASGVTHKGKRIFAIGDKERKAIRGHKEDVFDLAIDVAGKFLLSTSEDKTVRLWDLSIGFSNARIHFPRPTSNRFSR